MSVQFGRWNFEGPVPAAEYIEKVNATLAPYGPDSNESYSKDGLRILYRSFCTTKESHRETQPHVFASGAVLTWDGRLDNRAELIGELHDGVTLNSTDVEIVAAAYEKWGANCLGKLIGDWALSIWNPRERSVLLAKDPIGTEHLYYSFDDKQLTWSTILDPLVLFAGKTFEICEEYIAGWLTNQFPATHVTPYVGIQAVPPSCSVLLRPGKHGTKHTITKYWDFDPRQTHPLPHRLRIRRTLPLRLRHSGATPPPLRPPRPRRTQRRHGLLLHRLHGRPDYGSRSPGGHSPLFTRHFPGGMPSPRHHLLVRRLLRPPGTRYRRIPLDLQSRNKNVVAQASTSTSMS